MTNDQVLSLRQCAFFTIGASNITFYLPNTVFALINWQPIWIYKGYIYEYQNPFAESQSESTFLEIGSIYSEKKSYR